MFSISPPPLRSAPRDKWGQSVVSLEIKRSEASEVRSSVPPSASAVRSQSGRKGMRGGRCAVISSGFEAFVRAKCQGRKEGGKDHGWMDGRRRGIDSDNSQSQVSGYRANSPLLPVILSTKQLNRIFPGNAACSLQWHARISCTLGCNLVLSFCTEVVAKPMPNAFARL